MEPIDQQNGPSQVCLYLNIFVLISILIIIPEGYQFCRTYRSASKLCLFYFLLFI